MEHRGDVEVSDGRLVASEESLAMRLEMLVEVSGVGGQGSDVGFLGVLVEFSTEDDGGKFTDVVVGEVNKGISVPGLVGIGGVVAEMLAEVAQDGDGLVELLAVVGEHGKLAVREIAGGFAGTKGCAIEALILKGHLCVGEKHATEFNATVEAEVCELD